MILLLEVVFQIIKQMSEEMASTLKIMINGILIRLTMPLEMVPNRASIH